MRTADLLVASMLFACATANAATYQLTFTGKKLTPPPGCSNSFCSGVSGANQLDFVFSGTSRLPANRCSTPLDSGWNLVSFTDGANTLASLETAGWTIIGSQTELYVCTNSTGKKIVSWEAGVELTYNYPSEDYYAYEAGVSSTAHAGQYYPGDFYYAIQIPHVVNGSTVGVAEDWNPAKPGSWKLKKTP
jgi:hypothetical protein